ncbi:hypothetical protein [Flavobacterium daejeonense]|uniref:hypothetical protein n=1 Tax=Flavobacterium daejeonense TaxID=350893 RepID=UPI00047D6115|nr:hypothetical protein [Flavobacterium daejeonense]
MRKTIFALLINLAFASHQMNAQTNEEQVFKEKYLKQMEKNAVAEAQAQLLLVRGKYRIDNEMYKTLFRVYYNRKLEIEKALLLTGTALNEQKDLAVIISKYDSIANVYLQAIKTKSLIGDKVLDAKDNSKFASAVRNRERLKLNKEQIDNLIYQSKLMADMKKETPSLDLKAHERKLLPTILTDEQYTDLLVILNRKTASDWATNSWKHIKERGIDQGLDSTKVYREIYNYNLAKLVRKDRFGNDMPKTSASLARLVSEQPGALRMLQSDQARNVSNKPEAAKTKFAW